MAGQNKWVVAMDLETLAAAQTALQVEAEQAKRSSMLYKEGEDNVAERNLKLYASALDQLSAARVVYAYDGETLVHAAVRDEDVAAVLPFCGFGGVDALDAQHREMALNCAWSRLVDAAKADQTQEAE